MSLKKLGAWTTIYAATYDEEIGYSRGPVEGAPSLDYGNYNGVYAYIESLAAVVTADPDATFHVLRVGRGAEEKDYPFTNYAEFSALVGALAPVTEDQFLQFGLDYL